MACFDLIVLIISFFFKVCLRAVGMGSLGDTNRKIINSDNIRFVTALWKIAERMSYFSNIIYVLKMASISNKYSIP